MEVECSRDGNGREALPSLGKMVYRSVVCCSFALLLSIVASFFSFFCGLIALSVTHNFSASSPRPPPYLPTLCTIRDSYVDLKSSKICELGVLNYKAKNVFYPFERSRFRCRYDYYWASVFKVEYKDHSSGQTFHAIAEAPKEALPLECRPSFNTAWLTKDIFKVNQTYDCRYRPGISQVDIYPDNLFNCQAKEPSPLEMLGRYTLIFSRYINDLFSKTSSIRRLAEGAAMGIALGVSFPLIFITLVKLIVKSKSWLTEKWNAGKGHIAGYEVHFRRAYLLVAYVSAMGWLAIQYVKMLGLSEFLVISYVREKQIEM